MSTQAMERKEDRSPDVARAAQRLARPLARVRSALKRLRSTWCWRSVMLVALLPLFAASSLVLLAWRRRLVRAARAARAQRPAGHPAALPAAAGRRVGRGLERVGARELPLLLAVLRGRLSFVGPRALAPGTARATPGRGG